jgi:hypothetical protein
MAQRQRLEELRHDARARLCFSADLTGALSNSSFILRRKPSLVPS